MLSRIARYFAYLTVLLLAGCQAALIIRQLISDDVALLPQDRILVLAPHPDDEVLGVAGIIQDAVKWDLPVRLVFLTYGDFNEWSFTVYRRQPSLTPGRVHQMGLVRYEEAMAAAEAMGLTREDVIFLGYPDFGTLDIWYSHWGDSPPYRSRLTRVTAVPYDSALRPGAQYKGESILEDLTAIIDDFQPTKIFVSHPADTHPDHRAMYLFTRIALWNLDTEIEPEVYPYLVHYPDWPQPKRYDSELVLAPPHALEDSVDWQTYPLDPNMVEDKLGALQEHRTQMLSNARFLRRFIRTNELFGDFPVLILKPDAAEIPLSAGGEDAPPPIPEALTAAERELFVEAEAHSIRLEGDELVLTLELSRSLASRTNVSVYIFGYRSDRPFAEMTKLHVRFGSRGHAISDQKTRLPQDSIQIARHSRTATISVPLDVLDEPERLLVTARSYLQSVPLDWDPWRIVELSR